MKISTVHRKDKNEDIDKN